MAGAVDTFIAYQFIKILSTPWKETDAYRLGIIDENGNILKSHKDLTTNKERKAYTIFHRLVWNIKRLLDKLPTGKTRLSSFATALWLLKEHNIKNIGEDYDIEPLIILFEEYLGENNILLENNSNISFKDYLQLTNKKITEGKYYIKNSFDLIDDQINKNDIFICKSNTNPSDDMLEQNIYGLIHQKTGKVFFVAESDLEKI